MAILTCTCTKRFKDNKGEVIGYRIIDDDGNKIDVTEAALISAMRANKIVIENIELTDDDRILVNGEK